MTSVLSASITPARSNPSSNRPALNHAYPRTVATCPLVKSRCHQSLQVPARNRIRVDHTNLRRHFGQVQYLGQRKSMGAAAAAQTAPVAGDMYEYPAVLTAKPFGQFRPEKQSPLGLGGFEQPIKSRISAFKVGPVRASIGPLTRVDLRQQPLKNRCLAPSGTVNPPHSTADKFGRVGHLLAPVQIPITPTHIAAILTPKPCAARPGF